VTPGYAETLRLRLREGRFLTDRDTVGSVRSMMVNDEFVRQYLSAGPVVGRRFGDLYLNDKGTTSEIIGVVGNVLKDGNDRKPEPEVYFIHRRATDPSSRRIQGSINLAVRVEGDQTMAVSTLRTIVREVDRTATVDHVELLTDTLAASVAQPRFATTVLVTVAVLALALASIGLYGVLSYSVSQRRCELGVRAVLGADRGDLIRLVLREGLVVTSAGLIVGLLAAVGLTRLMEDLLFGVTPLDAVSFATAPLVLLVVAIAACLLPAGRAAAIDPAVALRSD
jgi:putative ABC transport system permease protein